MPRNRKRRIFTNRLVSRTRRLDRSFVVESLEQRMLLATITSVDPLANSHAAPVSTDISVTFDEAITPGSATPQTLVVHSTMRPNTTTVSATGMTVTADPTFDFFPNELVQVTATAGIQGATPTAPRVWQFHTGATAGSGEFVVSGQSIGDASANTSSYGVELGDLDGDGDLDAYVANNGLGNRVYLNDGTGVFADSGQSLGDHASREVSLGDVDGDGDLDAVVSNTTQETRVWQNNGSGVFTDSQSFDSGNSQGLQLGDLDGDGDLDAFVAISGSGNQVWRNNGGTFGNSGQLLGNGYSQSVS